MFQHKLVNASPVLSKYALLHEPGCAQSHFIILLSRYTSHFGPKHAARKRIVYAAAMYALQVSCHKANNSDECSVASLKADFAGSGRQQEGRAWRQRQHQPSRLPCRYATRRSTLSA